MAASLIAGLVRTTGSQVAKKGVKKIAVKKAKSLIKDKDKASNKKTDKLSKKSELISSEENKIGQRSSISKGRGETISSSSGTSKKLTIKESPSSKSQSEQLKINVTNIHKFLVESNNQYIKTESENKKLRKRQESKRKLSKEEKTLEKRTSPIGKSIKNIKNVITSTGSIFDKLFEFIGLIVAGIIVNALPAIITKVKEIIDNIVNFLTPIQSGFNLIMAFFTGEIDENKFNADKKRLDDSLENMNRKDGIIDTIAKKVGPFGGLVKLLKPAISSMRKAIGGKKMVLAKKDGKEGVLDTETNIFTERQFTSKERKRMDGEDSLTGDYSGSSGRDEDGDTVTSRGGTTQNEVSGFPISSHFGQRWGKLHGGIDVGTPTGTPLALAHAGKIMYAGLNGGYGNMIDAWVPHLNVQFRFAHLVKLFKKTGDDFKENEILGKTGGGAGDPGRGSSTGPHLHYEIDTQKNGTTYGGSKNKDLLYDMAKHVILGSSSSSSSGKGANIIPQIRGNIPSNQIVGKVVDTKIDSGMSENTSTYYYIQPVDTVQYQVVPFPVPMKKTSNTFTEQYELNTIWMK